MPPKRREKDGDTAKNPRMDHIQADHELFLQAFEKPTQIYRFLRTRNMISPIFLNRTLSYMKQRMSRCHKSRRGFKVDSLKDRIMKRNENSTNNMPRFMTLTFLGFYDKTIESAPAGAEVETVLLKVIHKKRKDTNQSKMTVSFGTNKIPFITSDEDLPSKCPTVSIPTNSFKVTNGSLIESYILILNVQYSSSNSEGDDEPAVKRRKSLKESKLYVTELVIYDKHNRCLLVDGDYEISLQEVNPNMKYSPRKHSSWENVSDLNENCGRFDSFNKGPLIKFKLRWTQEESNSLVDRPKLYPSIENKENIPQTNNNNNNINSNNNNNNTIQNRFQIIYQFLYNNNSRQQTEACEDLNCPWCSVNCGVLYALLKHLKLCHSRFNFTYVPITQGARIDVAINELYDGSYSGSPHDLISQPSGSGPMRRASVTHILVCRPKRTKPNLAEFIELDDVEYDGQRPYITGHNRLYHHTTTCLPIYPKEMDVDSEGENDPEWLQTKTMMMIDEFTDVNEGEKELMKMWNLHVMKHGFVGDCQIPLACTMFLQSKGKELLLNNLYRNFVLHLCSLFDFGLVSPVTLYNTVKKLQDLVGETGAIRKVLRESREAQMDNWVKVGLFQQPTSDRAGGSKTPQSARKTPAQSGQQRRKGTPSTVELPVRRKSGETSRKRLSLSLKKDDTQGKPLSS